MSHCPALHGLTVVERASRLATAGCGHLLASLGASVLTMESPEERAHRDALPAAERRLYRAGKKIALKSDIYDISAEADVVLLDARDDAADVARYAREASSERIVCAFSAAGLESHELASALSDAAVQALSGVMAVTGAERGAPELVRVPLSELTTAVAGTGAVLAGLAARERDGGGQFIDMALVDVMVDQLRTHIAIAKGGQADGFRIGCRHPLCSPWNAYRAADGWVLICSASDVQWDKILDVVGRPDLKGNSTFATAAARKKVILEVDDLVQTWTGPRSMAEVVQAFSAVGIPAGPALAPSQVPGDELLKKVGTLMPHERGVMPGAPFRLSRTPAAVLIEPTASEAAPVAKASPRLPASMSAMPLDGVKVVEISRYAAGPLAGLVLASLGAEVIKIESPGGEDCRAWVPQFGSVSGYFVNFNYGKASVVLDLATSADRDRMRVLIADADVLLHNLRAGVMEKLGFGYETTAAINPKLVYCAVSGYGASGPRDAALDTVIQGRLALTSLIGSGEMPLRVGFSIADQVAGHFAAAGIMAALHERRRSGLGQHVDTAMCDAVAWLTQTGWACGAAESESHGTATRVTCSDGWVVCDTAPDAKTMASCASQPRVSAVSLLTAAGISAVPVLELGEVLHQPWLTARGMVTDIATKGGEAPAIRVPLGLSRTRPVVPARMKSLDEDAARFAATGA